MPHLPLSSLFPIADLEAEIAAGYVREQQHPDDPRMVILNYADKAAYEDHWNAVTLQCRGLIVYAGYPEATVVSRPWPKFFNYGRTGAPYLDEESKVEITDKADGSLGILYPHPDGAWAVSTRGSMDSVQARHATRVLREHYLPQWRPGDGWTYLWEIVYPENRIVLDYGTTDDLILLGAVNTATGATRGPGFDEEWPGPRTTVFPGETLAAALSAVPRENAEGIVVRDRNTGAMVKLKQDDYVSLHRIITNTSSYRIWEHLAVAACKDGIKDRRHWGSYLHLDPARAEECIAAGDGWLDKMLDGVPDEFYTWVRSTIVQLSADAAFIDAHVRAVVADLAGLDRQRAFEVLADEPIQKVAMRLYLGAPSAEASLRNYAWDRARPEAPTLPFAQNQDAA